ncbi:MAG: hypothetical protein ACKVP7_10250 [Hyphomicrobiaceae bacterium]
MTIAPNSFFRGAASAVALLALAPNVHAQQIPASIDGSKCEAIADAVKAMQCAVDQSRARGAFYDQQTKANIARTTEAR